MRVTIGQINTTNGDYAGNVERVLRAIDRARADKADLVVLPEVAVQGYMSFDWFLDRDVVRHVDRAVGPDRRGERGLNRCGRHGAAERARRRGAGCSTRPPLLATASCSVMRTRRCLPEYDVFDDPRYFEPAKEQRLFEIAGERVGVAVCEDLWNDKTYWRERLYAHDPADELIAMGAQVLIVDQRMSRSIRARSRGSVARWCRTGRSRPVCPLSTSTSSAQTTA